MGSGGRGAVNSTSGERVYRRSRSRKILPDSVRGSSSTNSTRPSRPASPASPLTCARTACAVTALIVPAVGEPYVGLGREGVRAALRGHGDDGGLGHRRMAQQPCREFGGGDADASGGVEDVLEASDEGEGAVVLLPGQVAGSVQRSGGEGGGRPVEVAVHQSGRTVAQVDADLALRGRCRRPRWAQDDPVAGQGPSQGGGVAVFAGWHTDRGRQFRLAVSVADRDAPGARGRRPRCRR